MPSTASADPRCTWRHNELARLTILRSKLGDTHAERLARPTV